MTEIVDERQRLVAVERAARYVYDRFVEDERNGYRGRDRLFAIDILGKALASPSEGNKKGDDGFEDWIMPDGSVGKIDRRLAEQEQADAVARRTPSPTPGSPSAGAETGDDLAKRLVGVVEHWDSLTDAQIIAHFHRTKFAGGSTFIALLCNRLAKRAASRPQEQPRKATGAQVEAACLALWGEPLMNGINYRRMEDALNAALASVSPAAAQGWQETQATISAWCEATFGSAHSNARVASRANEEMAELLKTLTKNDADVHAIEEAADIVIILFRLSARMGLDLHSEIDRKMGVNRARQWNVGADGHGYHVKAAAPPSPQEQEKGEQT